jgi:hypothetical protein
VRLGNFAVSKQPAPWPAKEWKTSSLPPEWKVSCERRRGGGWSLLYCSRPSLATGGGRKTPMPADSEKAMFHAGSRFSRRWANYGRGAPKALACGPSRPLPHLLPATCDGEQVGDQAWFQLESCLRPTRPRQSL